MATKRTKAVKYDIRFENNSSGCFGLSLPSALRFWKKIASPRSSPAATIARGRTSAGAVEGSHNPLVTATDTGRIR